jgi:hypothetical protein
MIVIFPILLQSIKSDLTYLPEQLFTADCSVDDGSLRGRRIGIPGVKLGLKERKINEFSHTTRKKLNLYFFPRFEF